MSILTDRFRRKLTIPAYEVRRGDYLRTMPGCRFAEPTLVYDAELPHPSGEDQAVILTIADLDMQRYHDELFARMGNAAKPERYTRKVAFPLHAEVRVVRGAALDLPDDDDQLAARLYGATLGSRYRGALIRDSTLPMAPGIER